jgi:hypothetical protein
VRKICQIDVKEPLLGRLKPLASVGQSEWVALCSKGVSSGILQWVEPPSRLGQSARVHQSSFCLASGCSCRSPQLHCRRKNLVSSVELEPVPAHSSRWHSRACPSTALLLLLCHQTAVAILWGAQRTEASVPGVVPEEAETVDRDWVG